jgi:SAM-dependent methyltransferase
MNRDEYLQMFMLESSHWYFRGKRVILSRVLQPYLPLGRKLRILDLGCGTGGMLEELQGFGWACGLDASQAALGMCLRRHLTKVVLGNAATSLPFKAGSFDLVCAFDLLEHLPDEHSLILEAQRVLKPNGLFFITVPAFRFLWSEHDIALGHYRRYRAGDIGRLFDAKTLRVVRLTYYNTLLFPIALPYRWLSRSIPRRVRAASHKLDQTPRSDFFVSLPSWTNRALLFCFKSEGWLLQHLSFPIGLSLIAIARRC